MGAVEPTEENMLLASDIISQNRMTGNVNLRYAIAQELTVREMALAKAYEEFENSTKYTDRITAIRTKLDELRQICQVFKPYIKDERHKCYAAIHGTVKLEVEVDLNQLDLIQKFLRNGSHE